MKDIWKKIVLKPFFSIFFVLKKQASTNLGNASLNNNLLSVTWLIIYSIKYKMLRNEVYTEFTPSLTPTRLTFPISV